jgi:hypothetical protein
MSVESSLCSWLNWFLRDDPPLEDLSALSSEADPLSNRPKLLALSRRLLPPSLCPRESDTLDYLHIAVSCALLRNDYGPDDLDLTPDDQLLSILKNLYFLFRITRSRSAFEAAPLDELFADFEASRPSLNDFGLADQTHQLVRDNEKRREATPRPRWSPARSTGAGEVIQGDFGRLAGEVTSPSRRARMAPRPRLSDLGVDEDDPVKLAEMRRMRRVLGSGEKLVIEEALVAERERLAELKERARAVEVELEGLGDAVVEGLERVVAQLEARCRETDPASVRGRWNLALEAQERKVASRIMGLNQLLTLGRDLSRVFAE